MAEQQADHRVECALPLLDFDWKLKYAVASGTIAAVNKPLLRLEFYVSTSATKVGEPSLVTDNQTQPFVAEFSKAQLDAVIAAMDAIEQGLERG